MLPEGAKPILNADAGPGMGPARGAAGQGRGWGRLLGAVFVFSVVVGFGSLLAFYFVQNRDGALEQSAIPVVRADPRPMKLRPETPGGIEVPFQNTQIYDRVGQQSAGAAGAAGRATAPAADRPVERLLPGPEAPLPRPTPPPAPVASFPATPDVAPPPNAVVVAPPVATPVPPPAPAPASTRAAPTPVPLAVPPAVAVAPPAPTPPPPARPPVPVAAPAPASTSAGGGARIQLASVRAEGDAQREWARLLRQHGDVLGGLAPSYSSVDLGDRGVYVRLQAGPFPIPEAARAACETLRARGVGCNVVR